MTHVNGNLHISNDVIADIVGKSVFECYGVVGVSDPNATTPLSILQFNRARKGIQVTNGEKGVIVALYVVLEYGVNINVVTKNLRDQVSFVLSNSVQVPVESIEIHVTGIKVRK